MANDWEGQQKFDLVDKIVPPPDGQVIIGSLGTVVMSIRTYEQYVDEALLAEIRAGRTGEE